MLKRQRPSSPSFPAHFPPEPPLAAKYSAEQVDEERRTKRARPELTFSGMYASNAGSDYQSANNALYELHALNHHRMLFSSKSDVLPSLLEKYHHQEQEFEPEQQAYEDDSPESSQTPHFPVLEKICLNLSSRSNTSAESELAGEGQIESEEAKYVQERYEDTNRLLASLAQARLRRRDDHFS